MRSYPDPLVLTLLYLYATPSPTVNATGVTVFGFPVTRNTAAAMPVLGLEASGVASVVGTRLNHLRERSMRPWAIRVHCLAQPRSDRAHGRPIEPTLSSQHA